MRRETIEIPLPSLRTTAICLVAACACFGLPGRFTGTPSWYFWSYWYFWLGLPSLLALGAFFFPVATLTAFSFLVASYLSGREMGIYPPSNEQRALAVFIAGYLIGAIAELLWRRRRQQAA